jgi:hypothetical protein
MLLFHINLGVLGANVSSAGARGGAFAPAAFTKTVEIC